MPSTLEGRTLQINTAEVMLPLLEDARYKGAWGGRQGTKSHFFAELMVEESIRLAPLRSVCVRETQKSLADSVKQTIEDKIKKLGVEDLFEITNTEIRTPRGGKISFIGMQNHTAETVKSLEGYDRCWVEEAQSLSKRSLEVLRPTIMRKHGAQMWFSWNPSSPEDPVDEFLRGPNPPESSIVVHTNYYDNPWLDVDARKDIEHDRKCDLDRYFHVWEGAYETHSTARVFKNWTVEEFTAPDKTFFYLGGDWGFSVDPTVLVRCYAEVKPKPERSKLYIDFEAYRVGCEIDNTPALFDTVPGSRIWPIIADSARPETISYLRRHGFPRIEAAKKGAGSVKEGVIFLQGFDIIIHPRCKQTIEEFKYYSYVQDPKTEAISGQLADSKNHVIDAVRYACEKLMTGSVLRVVKLAGFA